jgi:hypothetical protein
MQPDDDDDVPDLTVPIASRGVAQGVRRMHSANRIIFGLVVTSRIAARWLRGASCTSAPPEPYRASHTKGLLLLIPSFLSP